MSGNSDAFVALRSTEHVFYEKFYTTVEWMHEKESTNIADNNWPTIPNLNTRKLFLFPTYKLKVYYQNIPAAGSKLIKVDSSLSLIIGFQNRNDWLHRAYNEWWGNKTSTRA